ncbi:hypothetical protein GC176_20535 [bacterium]|nr:hypothetical protein [bacterium]
MANAYFRGGGWWEKFFRLLNILEPGHMVLSLSKIAVWVSIVGVLVIALTAPAYFSYALGALGMSFANYAYRRKKQYDAGQPPYPAPPQPIPSENAPLAAPTPDSSAADAALDSLDLTAKPK